MNKTIKRLVSLAASAAMLINIGIVAAAKDEDSQVDTRTMRQNGVSKLEEVDISASVAINSTLDMAQVSKEIDARAFERFGSILGPSSAMIIYTLSGNCGSFKYRNGKEITTPDDLTYNALMNIVFLPTNTGTFVTEYSIVDGMQAMYGKLTVTVDDEPETITEINLSDEIIEMNPYSTHYISLSAEPDYIDYTVEWASDANTIVTIEGNGDNAILHSRGTNGEAVITATVTDSTGYVLSKELYVKVATPDKYTYNPSVVVIMDENYTGTRGSDSIANQFKSSFGITLGDDAKLTFENSGTTKYGKLFMPDRTEISADKEYTFKDLQNMSFEPYVPGVFSVPYSITYEGNTLSGTLYTYIQGTELDVAISQSQITLEPYSRSYVYLTINTESSDYTIKWDSSDKSIATIKENGFGADISSNGANGTSIITATITDTETGAKVVKSCSVSVMNAKGTTYSPSIFTLIGSDYYGTNISDSLAAQYKNLYKTALPNDAIMEFSSVGDESVGIIRLVENSPIEANKKYTFSDFKGMYFEKKAVGTYIMPYTLKAGTNSMDGNISIVVAASGIDSEEPADDDYSDNPNIQTSFADVPEGRWSNAAVAFVAKRGIFTGVGDNEFGPEIPMTRGMLMTVLARYAGADAYGDRWQELGLAWSVDNGISDGSDPEGYITREQLVTMLWRYAGTPDSSYDISSIADADQVSGYAANAVTWALETGIMNGNDDGTLAPQRNATREQVAQFFMNFINK